MNTLVKLTTIATTVLVAAAQNIDTSTKYFTLPATAVKPTVGNGMVALSGNYSMNTNKTVTVGVVATITNFDVSGAASSANPGVWFGLSFNDNTNTAYDLVYCTLTTTTNTETAATANGAYVNSAWTCNDGHLTNTTTWAVTIDDSTKAAGEVTTG